MSYVINAPPPGYELNPNKPGFYRQKAPAGYYWSADEVLTLLPGPGIGNVVPPLEADFNKEIAIQYIEMTASNYGAAIAPQGGVIPMVYGKQFVEGQIINYVDGLISYDQNWGSWVVAVCIGPINAINNIYVNGSQIPFTIPTDPTYGQGGFSAEIHLGGYSQGPNWLVGKLPGVAFVEIRRWGNWTGTPWYINMPTDIKFQFEVEGLIVPDMADSPIYSTNPALCLRDVLIDTEHGSGLAKAKIDTTSFTDAVSYYAGSGSTFKINGIFPSQQPLQTILDAMCLAANCKVYQADGVWKIQVQPVVGDVVHDFDTDTDCSNVQYSSIQGIDHPTRVTLGFRNADKRYATDSVTIEDPLIASGLIPIVEAAYGSGDPPSLQTTCITNEKQAHSVATKLFNQSALAGRVSFDTTTLGVNLNVGDLITLTSSDGLDHAQFLIQTLTRATNGFYSIQAQQYVTGMFSDKAITSDIAPNTNLTNPFDTPPDIILDAEAAYYSVVHKQPTVTAGGTTTVDEAFAGGHYQPPNYTAAKSLMVRCYVGSAAYTKVWEDLESSEREIPVSGNAPLNSTNNHNTLIADAVSVGTDIRTYSGDTATLLTEVIDYQKVRIIVKLKSIYGFLSAGVTIDYDAYYNATSVNNDIADVAEIGAYGAAYPNAFRLWWEAPRVIEAEIHYGAASWTLTNCASPVTSRVNDGLTALVAFDWNIAATSRCDLDLGATASDWKKFCAVRFVMNSTTFTAVPLIYYSDNGSSWTTVVPTYWQPYWSGTNIIGYTFEWPTPASIHRYWRFEKPTASAVSMAFTEIQWIAATGATVDDKAILNTLIYAKPGTGIVTVNDNLVYTWPGSAPRPDATTPLDLTNYTFTPGDGFEYLNIMIVEQCLAGNSTGKQWYGGTFSRVNADSTAAFGPIPASGNAAHFLNGVGQFTAPPAGTVTTVTGTAPVASSGGATPAISMAPASSGVDGYMTGTYATKLDGIATGAQPGTVTSVGGTTPIHSSGGNTPTITIDAATTSVRGTMSSADKTKLDGIASGAQPGTVTTVTGTAPIVSSGGTTPAISISAATTGAAGSMSAADKTKLDGIATGAQPGTVTAVGVTTANGVSGSSSGGTTPNLTITLGAITPSSIAATGAITSTGNITAGYSDERLKENIAVISGALDKVNLLSGVTFNPNALAESFGYTDKKEQVGLIAQQVREVLPQAVVPAPFDTDKDGHSKSGENYLTVQYEKLVPLLIESIKELTAKVNNMEEYLKHKNGFGYEGNGNCNGNGSH